MTTSNLSGSLAEFTVADVLVLLAMGNRTARLHLTAGQERGSIDMISGRVSAASADATRAVLLRSVVAALSVGVDDLSRAVREEDPIRELVDNGVVDRTAVQQVATEQCLDAVAEMLSWESGRFEVWVGDVTTSDNGLRLEPSDLVASARSRGVEWSELQAALPQPSSILALAPDVSVAPALDPGDWAVLARVDGRRTVDEVLVATGVSLVTAGHRLADLLTNGLVRVREADAHVDTHQQVERIIAELELSAGPEVEGPTTGTASPEPEPAPVADAEPPEPTAAPVELVVAAALSEPVAFGEPVGADEVAEFAATEEGPALADPAVMAPAAAAPDPSSSPGEVLAPTMAETAATAQPMVPADPVAELDEAGLEFAWSPWAQEMGLGDDGAAVEAAADTNAGSAELPAPQAPTVAYEAAEWSDAVLPAHAMPDVVETSGAHAESPAVPGRESESVDGVVPVTPAPGDEAAEAAVPEPRTGGTDAEDPLSDGLLGHLMSSVRGL